MIIIHYDDNSIVSNTHLVQLTHLRTAFTHLQRRIMWLPQEVAILTMNDYELVNYEVCIIFHILQKFQYTVKTP